MKSALTVFLVTSCCVCLGRGASLDELVGKAENGDSAAQTNLATFSSRWMLRAAEQGNALAQFLLGQALYNGQGVNRNFSEAIKWYASAAEQGIGPAQMALGGIYSAGQNVPRDSTEAAKWFMMSAARGDSIAQCQIARMHMTGAGVPKDDVAAYKWSVLAARQGNSEAKKVIVFIEKRMTPAQVAEGKARSSEAVDH